MIALTPEGSDKIVQPLVDTFGRPANPNCGCTTVNPLKFTVDQVGHAAMRKFPSCYIVDMGTAT